MAGSPHSVPPHLGCKPSERAVEPRNSSLLSNLRVNAKTTNQFTRGGEESSPFAPTGSKSFSCRIPAAKPSHTRHVTRKRKPFQATGRRPSERSRSRRRGRAWTRLGHCVPPQRVGSVGRTGAQAAPQRGEVVLRNQQPPTAASLGDTGRPCVSCQVSKAEGRCDAPCAVRVARTVPPSMVYQYPKPASSPPTFESLKVTKGDLLEGVVQLLCLFWVISTLARHEGVCKRRTRAPEHPFTLPT